MLWCYSLLFGGDNIERHNRQHGAIHRHGHRHLIERNLIEQELHVENGIDSHAGVANISGDALVVGVVSAMRGEVECNREPSLPGGQVAAIEGIGFFSGGKASILDRKST